MTNMEEQQDLVVLAADKDMEFAVRGIISRQKSLQIREITAKFLVHSKHDPGCLRDPVSLLDCFAKHTDTHWYCSTMKEAGERKNNDKNSKLRSKPY